MKCNTQLLIRRAISNLKPPAIMNYCNELWNNDGQLSKYDLIALQNLYGVPQ